MSDETPEQAQRRRDSAIGAASEHGSVTESDAVYLMEAEAQRYAPLVAALEGIPFRHLAECKLSPDSECDCWVEKVIQALANLTPKEGAAPKEDETP